MLSANKISMGFGLCKCKACRHYYWKHKKNKFRAYEYKRIIRQIRRQWAKEDIDIKSCHYTD